MVEYQTKEDIAYRSLRLRILSCELPPDEKIVIDRLAEEMGISQIPVRAAVQRLAAEGLVVSQPHSSAMVAPLSPDRIDEVFVLLEGLERTALRTAAGCVSEAGTQLLLQYLEQMESALGGNLWLDANIGFHRQIAALSGMPMLIDFTNRVLDEWQRISHYYFDTVTGLRMEQAQQEHRRIVDLLRAGDADQLEELAAQHNRSANRAYQQILRDR